MKTRKELIEKVQKWFEDVEYDRRIANDYSKYAELEKQNLRPLSFKDKLIRELYDRIVWDEREMQSIERGARQILVASKEN